MEFCKTAMRALQQEKLRTLSAKALAPIRIDARLQRLDTSQYEAEWRLNGEAY